MAQVSSGDTKLSINLYQKKQTDNYGQGWEAMAELNETVRTMVEKEVDDVIADPEKIEKSYSTALKAQGIEPNLDVILSFIIGYLFGRVTDYYWIEYRRRLSSEEFAELIKLFKRRAFEMRMAFMSTRVEK